MYVENVERGRRAITYCACGPTCAFGTIDTGAMEVVAFMQEEVMSAYELRVKSNALG